MDKFIINFDNNELNIASGSFCLNLTFFYRYCNSLCIRLPLFLNGLLM